MQQLFFLLALLFSAIYQNYNYSNTNQDSYQKKCCGVQASETTQLAKRNIVGFYHIYVGQNTHEEIVAEQLRHIKLSGLHEKLDKIYYGVVGMYPMSSEKPFSINEEKYTNVGDWDKGHEMLTQSKLWNHCRKNSQDYVLYYHTKGTFSHNGTSLFKVNAKFRHILNAFTLHPGCIKALDEGYDTCGFRLSPLPYIHYSGNFWWAQCRYINTLIDPDKMHIGSDKQREGEQVFKSYMKNYLGCMGYDRFFAEAWIGSAPIINGADCIDGNFATPYLFSYGFPDALVEKATEIMSSPSDFQIKCNGAATNSSKFMKNFQPAFNRDLVSYPCAKVDNLVTRSLLWYNQTPHSLLDWRAGFGEHRQRVDGEDIGNDDEVSTGWLEQLVENVNNEIESPINVPVAVNTSLGGSDELQNSIGSTALKRRIVAFFHISSVKRSQQSVVDEQIRVMNETGLLDILDTVYCNVVGHSPILLPPHESQRATFQLQGQHTLGTEVLTLSRLFVHCNRNPDDWVLYLHTLDAVRSPSVTTIANYFTLNPSCLEALDRGFDICGWRLSLLPFMHYYGNFWWARCRYVRDLVNPVSMDSGKGMQTAGQETFSPLFGNKYEECLGFGAFFPFAWIGSGPQVHPSDCLSPFISPDYTTGIGLTADIYLQANATFYAAKKAKPLILQQSRQVQSMNQNRSPWTAGRKGSDKPFVCDVAAMIVPENSRYFKSGYDKQLAVHPCSSAENLLRRQQIWYPETDQQGLGNASSVLQYHRLYGQESGRSSEGKTMMPPRDFNWSVDFSRYQSNHSDRLVGFYHIYAGMGFHDPIVKEQVSLVESSGVLDRLHAVYYSVVSDPSNRYTIPHPKFRLMGYHPMGHEMITLSKLFRFCRFNPSYTVLYFHTKGSLNYATGVNIQFRHVLNAFTLHPGCIKALDEGYDTCGFRLSPLPYIHYSGNFWWAQCRYINTLIDPAAMSMYSAKQEEGRKLFEPSMYHSYWGCLGYDRFFAEAWLGSGIRINGADCLNGSIGLNYLFGHGQNVHILNAAKAILSDPVQLSGQIQCHHAAVNRSENIPKFQSTFDSKLKEFKCANVSNLVLRTYSWYNGSLPESLLAWRKLFGENIDHLPSVAQFRDLIHVQDPKPIALKPSSTRLPVTGFKPIQFLDVTQYHAMASNRTRLKILDLIALNSSGSRPSPPPPMTKTHTSSSHIVAFYHIYCGSEFYRPIVEEQVRHIVSSNLLQHLDAVYYSTVRDPDNSFTISIPKFIKTASFPKGHESLSLAKLYDFCRFNPSYKVLYFHTKGSMTSGQQNDNFRHVLNAFTLHPGCIKALDEGYDTCGFRLSPLPYIHYSGNFWWAQCRYINTLIDPDKMHIGSDKQAEGSVVFKPYMKNYLGCMGYDRFFAEAWIGSAPIINGADCIPAAIGNDYLFGHAQSPLILQIADKINANPGQYVHNVQCTQAATNSSQFIGQFQKTFDEKMVEFPCSKVENLITRTRLWYQALPLSLIKWRAKFGEVLTNFEIT